MNDDIAELIIAARNAKEKLNKATSGTMEQRRAEDEYDGYTLKLSRSILKAMRYLSDDQIRQFFK